MSRVARVVAQAKINLLLRVLAREASGYHSIETVFLRLELGDDVDVRVGGRARTLACTGPALPEAGLGPMEHNLAFRAASAYADATGWPSGFEISIEKRIPVGGGLGGGSADAGAVLRALDALAPRPLGEQLLTLAAPLGADVPFLATDEPMALAWGRGERMLPQPPLASRAVALVVAPFSIATRDAYGWLADSRGAQTTEASILRSASLATWEGIAEIAANDLEPVVGARHHAIATAIDVLRGAGATIAMMSGSGSTTFGIFDEAPDTESLARGTGGTVLPTRTAARVVRVRIDE